MKKIILFLYVSIVQISFGQCIDLTVGQHISGDPLFRLDKGDIVQICPDSKIISFGGTTLYILNKVGFGSTLTYDFKMDNVYYSPKYGEIQINTDTKKFAISLISGNQGAWTYLNEADIQSQYEEEQKKIKEEINLKISIDKKTYSQIDQALNDDNIELAITKLNSLNYPKGYPRYNEFVKKQNEFLESEDLKIIDSIKLSLNKGEINNAIEEYSKLSVPDSNIKNLIQTAINSKTYEEVKTLSNDLSGRIIKDYSSLFSDLPNGQYSLSLDKKGVVTILDSTKSNPKQICTNKNYLIIDGFEFPINYEGKVIISSEYSRNNLEDSTRYIFAEKYKRKDLYVSVKGFYYAGKFGAPLSAKIVDKPQFISTKLGKNEVSIENLYLVQKKANGILINQSKLWQKDKSVPLKSGIGRKIVKSITAPIWIWFFIL